MFKRSLKRAISVALLAALTVSSAAGCGKKETKTEATYTMNDYMAASPTNWNPHTWENDADNYFSAYTEMGLVDISIAEDGVNYTWVYEMADSITDITASFANKEKWEIPADATANYVYEIKLNQGAKWQDGTPINADTYVYSMQQLLNPDMKNYRANTYYNGTTAIKNAFGYYNNDLVGQPIYGAAVADVNEDGTHVFVNDKTPAFKSDVACAFYGDTVATYYAQYKDSEQYAALAPYMDDKVHEVTDELKTILTNVALLHGDSNPLAWEEFLVTEVGTYEATPWENVGLVKVDDYTLHYILEQPCTEFYFLSNMTGNWIVYEKLYEAGKKTVGDLVATNYGTSVDTYMSFGPYKLVGFETDKQFRMEKNENWYGYTDGKHKGQFMTTHIVCDVIPEHSTALQLFLQGKLDGVSLEAADLETYRMSDFLLKVDETYTMRFIFGTDLEKLIALEEKAGDGSNKRVLYYDDFRKALSLAINRADFTAKATSGFKPAYFLLNYLYYYDIENNSESQYRNTTQAKQAVLDLYGIEYGAGKEFADIDSAFNAVTGYDVEEAKKLFQSVYEQAIKDGNYKDGQAINIRAEITAAASLSSEDIAQQDLLNEFVAAATKGTGFEGKITFKFEAGATDRYIDVATGKVEMIRGAWGGAAFYPFSTIRVYCEPEHVGGLQAIHESCGWDPTAEAMTLTYDFNGDGKAEEVTKTLQDWAKSINDATQYAADPDVCLFILSKLEGAILSAYQCIPVATYTACQLYSKQIKYFTLDYNIMYGFGGTRLMTYNYSDQEWEEYVKSQGGALSYE